MKTRTSPSRWRTPLLVCGTLLLITFTAGAATWWWINRPITPTILTAAEQTTLTQKIEAVQTPPTAPDYVPGSKTIVLTERELNGLLGLNDLGDQFHLDLAQDAIHARLNTDIPDDAPFLGGKKLKAKARFYIKEVEGQPSVVLNDLSIWGISLPNAWLGNLKGENLVEVIADELGSNPIADGIESLEINSNEIVIHLAE
jgi:hypothetical protein